MFIIKFPNKNNTYMTWALMSEWATTHRKSDAALFSSLSEAHSTATRLQLEGYVIVELIERAVSM